MLDEVIKANIMSNDQQNPRKTYMLRSGMYAGPYVLATLHAPYVHLAGLETIQPYKLNASQPDTVASANQCGIYML
jgi:hypothetical protein